MRLRSVRVTQAHCVREWRALSVYAVVHVAPFYRAWGTSASQSLGRGRQRSADAAPLLLCTLTVHRDSVRNPLEK